MELFDIVKDNEKLKEERLELAEKLKNNSRLLKYCHENGIDESLIEKYPMKFSRFAKQLEICDSCRCLDECISVDKGYRKILVFDDGLKEEVIACSYRKEEIRKEKEELRLNPYLKNFLINDLPVDQRETKLESIDFANETSKSYLRAVDQIKNWIDSDITKGLYLYGNVGVGKTYLAAAIANKFAEENRKIVFIHMPSYQSRLKKAFDDYVEFERLNNVCLSCDVLVCDDIGAEAISSWYRDEILLPILNTRMNEKKLTVFTSNLDMKQLQEKFKYTKDGIDELAAERLADRIRVLSNPIEVGGRNRRG